MQNAVRLILGTASQSSWSMRAFLCASPLIQSLTIDWRTFDVNDRLADASGCPTGKVPVLYPSRAEVIVESFAIAETLAELGGLQWPEDRRDRASARSLCLEFQAASDDLRKSVPMDLSSVGNVLAPHPDLIVWMQRLDKLLQQSDGPFLYGHLSIADAWFSPVIARAVRCDVLSTTPLAEYFEALKLTQCWRCWMGYVDNPSPIYVSLSMQSRLNAPRLVQYAA